MLDNLFTALVGAAADISASLKTLNQNLATLNAHIASGAVALPTPVTLEATIAKPVATQVAANIDKVVATEQPKVQETEPHVAPSPTADAPVATDPIAKEYTFDDVKAVANVALKRLGKDPVMELLNKHGASGLSKLDPSQFTAFIANLNGLMGIDNDVPF